jgi:hypothetical protein
MLAASCLLEPETLLQSCHAGHLQQHIGDHAAHSTYRFEHCFVELFLQLLRHRVGRFSECALSVFSILLNDSFINSQGFNAVQVVLLSPGSLIR